MEHVPARVGAAAGDSAFLGGPNSVTAALKAWIRGRVMGSGCEEALGLPSSWICRRLSAEKVPFESARFGDEIRGPSHGVVLNRRVNTWQKAVFL